MEKESLSRAERMLMHGGNMNTVQRFTTIAPFARCLFEEEMIGFGLRVWRREDRKRCREYETRKGLLATLESL